MRGLREALILTVESISASGSNDPPHACGVLPVRAHAGVRCYQEPGTPQSCSVRCFKVIFTSAQPGGRRVWHRGGDSSPDGSAGQSSSFKAKSFRNCLVRAVDRRPPRQRSRGEEGVRSTQGTASRHAQARTYRRCS
eukprot:COSAG01_NODE_1990_length_8697_cov_5.164922_11_plen_137_part_00